MKAFRLFLLILLIAAAGWYNVQGQYGAISAYSSNPSMHGAISSTTSRYGQYLPAPGGQGIPQAPRYSNGTVLSIVDENIIYVDFTDSNIPGLEGVTLILLPRSMPMKDLLNFQGKELSFSLLGHDILGRPICQAYFDGVPIDFFKQYRSYEYHYYYYYPGYRYYYPMYTSYSPWE